MITFRRPDFLSEVLRVAHAVVGADKHPAEAFVVLDDDQVGVQSRNIGDHAMAGFDSPERNLSEEIDQVVMRTLAGLMGQRRRPQPLRPPGHSRVPCLRRLVAE